MFEDGVDLKIENEVEVTTTWGFPESIDPETVIFFGEDEFGLALESEAKNRKPVLCRNRSNKAHYTLGNVLDDECYAKIDRFYEKPDYKEILVSESGDPAKNLHLKQAQQNQDDDSNSVSSSSNSDRSKQMRSISVPTSSPTLPTKQPTAPTTAPLLPTFIMPKPSRAEPWNENPTTYQDLGLTDEAGAYPCLYCSRTFMIMNDLKAHCVTEHGSNKPFKCRTCGKCFQNSRQLLLHTMIHTGEKHHPCIYCPQSFRLPAHRNNHMRITHGDDHPYKCDQRNCSSVFQTTFELSKHQKIYHRINRKTKCRYCMIHFESTTQYQTHECPKKQKRLNCGACGEKYYKMADVLHHSKFCKYIDPNDVQCEKCGTKFENSAKCSVHKTYLCTGEPVSEKEGEADKEIKTEMEDFDNDIDVTEDSIIIDQSRHLEEMESSNSPDIIKSEN